MSKITIIGAGLTGLTAAISLTQSGHDVTVFEKTKALTNIGGAIFLYPHGIRVLKALGLDHIISEIELTPKNYCIYDESHQLIFNHSLNPFFEKAGEQLIPVSRSKLQQLLVHEFDTNKLIMNHKCIAVSQESGKTRAEFENGHIEEADIIVGADGIHSAVRDSMLATPSETYYSGLSAFGAIYETERGEDHSNDQNINFHMRNGQMAICCPLVDNKRMIYIFLNLPLDEFDSAGDKRAQVQSRCANWHENVTAAIEADLNEHTFYVPAFELKRSPDWSLGNIVTIGDAAHAIGPVIGQGCSMGLEDAYILTKCLQNNMSDTATKLKALSAIRTPYIDRIHALELKAQQVKLTTDPEIIKKRDANYRQANIDTLFAPIAVNIDMNAFQAQLMLSLGSG